MFVLLRKCCVCVFTGVEVKWNNCHSLNIPPGRAPKTLSPPYPWINPIYSTTTKSSVIIVRCSWNKTIIISTYMHELHYLAPERKREWESANLNVSSSKFDAICYGNKWKRWRSVRNQRAHYSHTHTHSHQWNHFVRTVDDVFVWLSNNRKRWASVCESLIRKNS